MRKKKPIPFAHKFPNADPLALKLLERLLAFEPKDRPTAEEALADPYFRGLANVEREALAQAITKMEFEFERRRVTKEDMRELIYREILEYNPQMLKEFMQGGDSTNFMYPSAVDQFKKQFAYLEEHYGKGVVIPLERQHASLPRPCVLYSKSTAPLPDQTYSCSSLDHALEAHNISSRFVTETKQHYEDRSNGDTIEFPLQVPQKYLEGGSAKPGKVVGSVVPNENCGIADAYYTRRFTNTSSQYVSSNYSHEQSEFTEENQQHEKKVEGEGQSNLMYLKAQYAGLGARKNAVSHNGITRQF